MTLGQYVSITRAQTVQGKGKEINVSVIIAGVDGQS